MGAEAVLYVALYAGTYLFVVPILVFVHELGHAVAALAVGSRPTIQLGTDPAWTATVGPLTVHVDPGGWRSWWYGVCRFGNAVESRPARVVAHLAGPAATSLALLVVTAFVPVTGPWARFVLYVSFWWLVITLVPVRCPDWFGAYAGMTSDGYDALECLRG